MSRGKSGRIVLEVDPKIKRELYLALEQDQITLKGWFLETASNYIKDNLMLDELLIAENHKKYLINKE